MGYELRDYQQECVDILDTKGATGRHLVAVATGLGKSVIFTHIKRRGRTLILSHRDELVRQPEKYYDGVCSFGIEKADEHSNGEDVVSASVQTLSRDSRLEEYGPSDFHTIIVDECHHAASPSYRKVLGYFSGAEQVLGFTTTPKRGDGVRLTDVFDNIIFTRDLRWGIKNGWLSSIRTLRIYANYSLANVKMTAGDFNIGDLDDAMSQKVYAKAAKTYVQECHSQGRHTLVYCVSIKACILMQEVIQEQLPEEEQGTICVLTGQTPAEERAGILKGFMSGNIKCIINCMVLTEGTDLPICDAVINLRPTCNISLYQQICGRATRLYENKEYSLVIDVVPDDERKLRNLCTAPTLFGIDPSVLDKKVLQKINPEEDLLTLCGELVNSVADLSRQMEITVQTDEAFVQDRMDILTAGGQDMDIVSAAARYRSCMEYDAADNMDIDFGDLYVETMPDDQHRYSIRAGWDGRIHMSKPDILGNTTIDFLVSPSQLGFSGRHHYIADMPIEKAVQLAAEYCMTIPEYQWHSWNREVRNSWQLMPATEKQKWRVRGEYSSLGFDPENIGKLSKLDANELIDLKSLLDEKKKEIKLYAPGKKGPRKAALDKFKEMTEKREGEVKAGRQNFQAFEKRVHSVYGQIVADRKRKEEELKQRAVKWDEIEKNGYFELSVISPTTDEEEMTSPQEGFLRSLELQLHVKHVDIDMAKYIGKHRLTIGEASMLIEASLYLLNQLPPPPEGLKAMITVTDIDNAVKENTYLPDTTHNVHIDCHVVGQKDETTNEH